MEGAGGGEGVGGAFLVCVWKVTGVEAHMTRCGSAASSEATLSTSVGERASTLRKFLWATFVGSGDRLWGRSSTCGSEGVARSQ